MSFDADLVCIIPLLLFEMTFSLNFALGTAIVFVLGYAVAPNCYKTWCQRSTCIISFLYAALCDLQA